MVKLEKVSIEGLYRTKKVEKAVISGYRELTLEVINHFPVQGTKMKDYRPAVTHNCSGNRLLP
jgi:hypothetical protein